MKRLLWLSLSLCMTLATPGWAGEEEELSIPIDEATSPTSESLTSPRHKTCGPGCVVDTLSTPQLIFDRNRLAWTETSCKDFSVKSLCEAAIKECLNKYPGNSSCWSEAAELQEIRFSSPELRQKILLKAKHYYQSIVHGENTQARCCGQDQKCKQKFASTGFKVLLGLPKDDKNYYYLLSKHTIYLSEAMLFNSLNEEGVERAILHELGHACQTSRNHAVLDFRTNASCALSGSSLPDLISTVGPKTANCLFDSLMAAARKRNKNEVCKAVWMQEAFADAVFAFKKNRLAHWAWDCRTLTDSEHGPSEVWMGCIFQRTQPRSKFCRDDAEKPNS